MKNLNIGACRSVIVKAAIMISDLETKRKTIWGTKDAKISGDKFIKSQSIEEEQQVWATVIKDLQIFIEKEQNPKDNPENWKEINDKLC